MTARTKAIGAMLAGVLVIAATILVATLPARAVGDGSPAQADPTINHWPMLVISTDATGGRSYGAGKIAVATGTRVLLMAHGRDRDSDKLSYRWSQLAGRDAGIAQRGSTAISVTVPSGGCTLTCEVWDLHGGLAAQVVRIIATEGTR